MQLLDLPPEILDQIIDWCMPHGFESFVLSCKSVHARSKPLIPLHNDLKKKWTRAENDSPYRGDTLRFLREIAKQPLVARYISTLLLWDRRLRLNRRKEEVIKEENEYPGSRFRQDSEAMRGIKEVVLSWGAKYFDLAGISGEEWWREVEQEMKIPENTEADSADDSPFATISLLLCLPNVKELQLSPRWGESRWYVEGDREKREGLRTPLLDALTRACHDPKFAEKSLGKLEVIFPFMSAWYEAKAGFGDAEWFILMPSVKEVFLTSCLAVDDGYTGIPFNWHIPDIASNAYRLELAFCCIDTDGISKIVSRMPQLSIFKYGHECKWHGCLFDWNAGTFLEAVAKQVGHNIVELGFACEEIGAVENGVDDFKHAFPRLRKLDIDVRVLMAPPVSSGQMRGDCGFCPKGMKRWEEGELPCLATILPPTLEELHLNTDFPSTGDISNPHAKALITLLNGFKQEREKYLPNLNNVVVRQFNVATAKSIVEDQGCVFESWNPQNDEHHRKARSSYYNRQERRRMPLWIREFEDRIEMVEYA